MKNTVNLVHFLVQFLFLLELPVFTLHKELNCGRLVFTNTCLLQNLEKNSRSVYVHMVIIELTISLISLSVL